MTLSMNASIFSQAHKEARVGDPSVSYRERFSAALRRWWDFAKKLDAYLYGDSNVAPVRPEIVPPPDAGKKTNPQPIRVSTLPCEAAKDAMIRRIAEKTNRRFFTIRFTKRTNGEYRVMNAKYPLPARFSTGRGHRFNPVEKRLLQVYDVKKGAPRFASLDSVDTVTANGYRFEFDGLKVRTYWTA